MGEEYEVTILDIDKDGMAAALLAAGARQDGIHSFRRVEFRTGGTDGGRHSWVRVRTDGKETTLTFKELSGGDFTPMGEYEVKTSDFKETARIMGKMAGSEMLYWENAREAYRLGDLYITLDTWPGIPTYMEIEAPSEEKLREAVGRFGGNGKLVGNVPIKEIYARYGLDFREVMRRNEGKLRELLNE